MSDSQGCLSNGACKVTERKQTSFFQSSAISLYGSRAHLPYSAFLAHLVTQPCSSLPGMRKLVPSSVKNKCSGVAGRAVSHLYQIAFT